MLFGRDQLGRDPFGRSGQGDNFSTVAPFGAFLTTKDADLAFIIDARPWGHETHQQVETMLTDPVVFTLDEVPVDFYNTPILFLDGVKSCNTYGLVGQSQPNRLDIQEISDPGVPIGNVYVRGDSVGDLAINWPGGPPNGGNVTSVYQVGAVVTRGYQDYERSLFFSDTDRVFPPIVKVALKSRNDGFVGLGRSVSSGGTSANCTLVIADGSYDEWTDDLQIDGRQITVLLGSRIFNFGDFQAVFEGLGQRSTFDHDTIKLGIRDHSEKLAVPIQTSLYLGDELTNPTTLEGGEAIKGRRKPRCFGECKNINLVQINRGFLCYQFNDGPVSAVTTVYDRGVPLTASEPATPPFPAFPLGSIQRLGFASVFSWTAMSVPPLAGGEFIYDLATGIIRTNAQPLGAGAKGAITADVKGDANGGALGVAGYTEKIGDLIRRIGSVEGTIHQDNDVDISELNQLQIDQPGKFQSYYDGSVEVSVIQAIDTLINSAGAMRESTRTGKLTASVVKFRTPVVVFEESDIITIKSSSSSSPIEKPSNKTVLGYAQSYVVQENEPEDILPGATIPHKEFVADEFRRVMAPSLGGLGDAVDQTAVDLTLTRRLLSEEVEINTKFVDKFDANVEVKRRHALLEPDYRNFDLVVKDQRFLLRVGETVTVKYPRFGLDLGRDFIILGIDEDTNSLLTGLRVWGGRL